MASGSSSSSPPTGAVQAPNPADPAAVLRDQLWTLLHTRYDALRAAASVVLGFQSLDQHMPPLGTRVAATKKTAASGSGAAGATSAPEAKAPGK